MTHTTEIQIILRGYYKQLYANKMDSLKEMDKFLEKYNFPRLNQEDIYEQTNHKHWRQNVNRSITSSEIKTVSKKLPANQSLGLEKH